MKKKLLFTIAGILLLFIITNPSATAFKEYRGSSSYSGLRRSLNLFVLSKYTDRGNDFIGVFGNFIKLEKSKPTLISVGNASNTDSTIKIDSAAIDSSKMVDTAQRFDEYGIPIRRKKS